MRSIVCLTLLLIMAGCSESPSIPEGPGSLLGLCDPQSGELASSGFKSEAELAAFLNSNKVTLVNNVPANYLVQFALELKLFPAGLRDYLSSRNVGFHLINGHAVIEDPTFNTYGATKTNDGREWKNIVGVGTDPTRIVVNRLYQGHGSTNLVLHERAHTLDLQGLPGIGMLSKSDEWSSILRDEMSFRLLMKNTCGTYCTENSLESFAEGFAIYFSCARSRTLLKDSPRTIQFMKKLEAFSPTAATALSRDYF